MQIHIIFVAYWTRAFQIKMKRLPPIEYLPSDSGLGDMRRPEEDWRNYEGGVRGDEDFVTASFKAYF